MIKRFILLMALMGALASLSAQEALGMTGGDASSSAGSEAFSAGLVVYTEITGPGGSATQGIQFSHEIYAISVHEESKDVTFKVYPNPSSEQLIIHVNGETDLQYNLYNTLGLKLNSGKLNTIETTLQVAELPAGLYLLDIVQQNKSIKTYKIIKK